MPRGDRFLYLLLGLYAIAATLYGFDRQPWKALYWVGAALITLAVLNMKG